MLATLWKYKMWWLVPLIVIVIVFGLLLFLAATSDSKPFVYPLF